MGKYQLKKVVFACLLGVQLITVTACTGKTDNSVSTTSNDGSTVVYGEVTAVDGKNITISVGTLNQNGPQPGGKEPGDGQSQEQPGGDGKQPGDGQPPAKPSDNTDSATDGQSQDAPADKPGDGQSQDKQNGGAPGMPSMLTLTGEEKTITISDESIITSGNPNDSADGLSAITVGVTVAFTYDKDQTLTKVEVMGNMQKGHEKAATDQSSETN